MKGVEQEKLLIGIMICALVVAAPPLLDFLGRSAVLNRAVKRGDIRKATALLNNHPDLVNKGEKQTGATPLHWAVIADQPDMARFLLKRGAAVNAPDRHGLTPLHKASSFNRSRMAELLISQGADLNARGIKYNAFFVNPLHLAAEAGFVEVVEVLLASGADANARTGGTNAVTSLHIAASRGHYGVAQLLLENGADVNAEDSMGRTPLVWARESGQDQIDELLRVYGGRE